MSTRQAINARADGRLRSDVSIEDDLDAVIGSFRAPPALLTAELAAMLRTLARQAAKRPKHRHEAQEWARAAQLLESVARNELPAPLCGSCGVPHAHCRHPYIPPPGGR
jgi:hypothetical protein